MTSTLDLKALSELWGIVCQVTCKKLVGLVFFVVDRMTDIGLDNIFDVIWGSTNKFAWWWFQSFSIFTPTWGNYPI